MKKFLIFLMIATSISTPIFAETISYDKPDFAEISSVIDDAAYDKMAMLFTDYDYPPSNRCYQAIGYQLNCTIVNFIPACG